MKDELLYIDHMIDAVRKIDLFIKGKTRNDFDNDEILRLALTHLIQIIGEAASKVSASLRSKYPDVLWNDIIGMRNKLVHDYSTVRHDVVWDTSTKDIQTLIKQLEHILSIEDAGSSTSTSET